MQRGKRKSPFTGGSESLDSGILYTRYTDLSQILLEPYNALANAAAPAAKEPKRHKAAAPASAAAAPQPAAAPLFNFAVPTAAPPAAAASPTPPVAAATPAAVAAATPTAEPASGEKKARKKERWNDEKRSAAKAEREALAPPKPIAGMDGEAAAALAAAPAKEKKETKKTKALKALAPEERVSGPGNADEAEAMRAALGYVKAPEAKPAGAVFSFGFTAAAPAAAAAAAPAADDSSNEESSDEEVEVEANAVQAPPAALGTGAPADASPSSSDEEEESEEKSESEEESSSSSSSDDEAAAAAPPQAEAAAGGGVEGEESEYVPRRIYAGGMPYGYTQGQVEEYWGFCGAIEAMDLMTFPDTGRFRGIAFITYATEEGYAKALACDGEDCDGQTVKVQKCKWSAKDRAAQAAARLRQGAAPVAAAAAAPAPVAAAAPAAALYAPPASYDAPAAGAAAAAAVPAAVAAPPRHVGRAPKTPGYHVAYVGNVAYEADEKAIQALFAPFNVTKVRLHTDKDSGKPKGFAHVHFKDEESLDGAMELDGAPLVGRPIRIGYAQPKKS